MQSCQDTTLRQGETYLLRNAVSPSVVSGLLPYVDDTNLATRDDVLTCMVTNQQVAVIPRIAKLDATLEAQGSNAASVTTLSDFQTKDAVPYLNPLLFSFAYCLRLNTMLALNNLADKTSIPYLMLALRDPDPQKVIPESADGLLHQFNPLLGPAPDLSDSYFEEHRAMEMQNINAWWRDELNGKHLQPGEKPAVPNSLPDTAQALYPLLYALDTAERRATLAKLTPLVDAGSIPYLILALQDQDNQQEASVAYQAYRLLHRLIPSLGQAHSLAQFTADPTTATQPIYAWWQDELMGKHLAHAPTL